MKLPRLARLRGGSTIVVVIVLVGALAFALSAVVRPQDPKFALISGTDPGFTITSRIYGTYAAGTCSGTPTAKLYPGVTRCLAVTVHNPLSVAIDVTALSMAVSSFTRTPTNHHSPGCSDTMVRPPALFTSAFTVTAGTTKTIDKPIKLVTTNTTQDACENGTFHFSYAATATFTDGTTTVLAASASPTEGSPVSFTATVTAKNPTYDHTTKPHGKVALYRCTTSSCAKVASTPPVTATITGTTGRATFPGSLLPAGTLYFEAKYQGTGTNFIGSTSNVLTLTVQLPATSCASAPTSKATTVIKGTVGSIVVPPFHSVWLDGGTVTGSVQVAFLGSFAATTGTIEGNLNSAGIVSLEGTTVKGSVNAAGALGVGGGSTIGGDLDANAALALCVNDASVTGGVSVHGLPVFFSLAKLCDMSVTGNVTYSFDAAPVELGGSGCAGDTIKGSLAVHDNSRVTVGTDTVRGGVTVSFNGTATVTHNTVTGNLVVERNVGAVTVTDNAVTGNIAVSYNGGGTLTSNKATGTCSLGPDVPQVTGKTNTVPKGHANTCNRKA